MGKISEERQLEIKAKMDALIEALKNSMPYFKDSNFSEKLRVNKSAVSKLRNGKTELSPVRISQIIEAFPQVSREWLEKGEGEILKKSVNPVQNINGTNAQGTQIIGDGQTTNNYIQPCGEEQTETSKLIDAHNTLIEQIRQLTAVIASQQETISRLVANNQ